MPRIANPSFTASSSGVSLETDAVPEASQPNTARQATLIPSRQTHGFGQAHHGAGCFPSETLETRLLREKLKQWVQLGSPANRYETRAKRQKLANAITKSFKGGGTHLECRRMESLPDVFQELRTLESFYIADHVKEGIPPLPPNLSELRGFGCFLQSLPTLPARLETLKWEFGYLDGLPTLPNTLKFLNVRMNHIRTLPPLPSGLVSLDVAKNFMCALPALPDGLVSLTLDERAFVNLSSLPSSVRSLTIVDDALGGFNETLYENKPLEPATHPLNSL